MPTVFSLFMAIALLGVLIVAHELGHYWVGRRLGLPVVELSVGFGPALIKRERKGIVYSLRLIPLGGYCTFNDEAMEGRPSFLQMAAWRRLLTFISGPAMNLFVAYLLAMILLTAVGLPYITNRIHSVESGMPAAEAGIEPGDAIVAVNGQKTETPSEFIRQSGESVHLTVERDGITFELTMGTVFDETAQAWRIGVSMLQDYRSLSLGESIRLSGTACWTVLGEMIDFLRDLVLGKQDTSEVMGLIGTVSVISAQAQEGFAYSIRAGIGSLFNMAIMLSLNLGLINLLPLPALDGGRIIFSMIEMVARRPVPHKVESVIHGVGFALLFGLMILMVFKDVIGLMTGGLTV